MATYDAGSVTNRSKRSVKIYKDLNLDFQQNTAIKNYEPRCRLVDVSNRPNLDKNGYSVSISFYVVNTPNPVVVETFLERLR